MILEQVLVLASITIAAWILIQWLERRQGAVTSGHRPGVTVVTSPTCRLCAPTVAALRGAGVDPYIIDASESGPEVRSLPTVIVADSRGRTIIRRCGRAALTDLSDIREAAAALSASPRQRTSGSSR